MASQSIRGPNVTSGGNLPGRSTLPSPSSVSSGDRPSSSDVSGMISGAHVFVKLCLLEIVMRPSIANENTSIT